MPQYVWMDLLRAAESKDRIKFNYIYWKSFSSPAIRVGSLRYLCGEHAQEESP